MHSPYINYQQLKSHLVYIKWDIKVKEKTDVAGLL